MQRRVLETRLLTLADGVILLFLATIIYGVVTMSAEWQTQFRPSAEISLSFWALPKYALLSAFRGLISYFVALVFTMVMGFLAAKNKAAERIILPLLDIGQSIPVLGFLPGVVLGLIALFPDTNLGLELAAILLIFTSQAWNMAFAFYESLKGVPADLSEASSIMGFNGWQRFKHLELPFAARNLAWNSVLSMAGGWFFLSACEAFVLGDQKFLLPGIGSYMSVAVAAGDHSAIIAGVGAMVFLILAMDFFIWHPVMSWVQRFRAEDAEENDEEEPLMATFFRESRLLKWIQLLLKRTLVRRRLRLQSERDSKPGAFVKLPPSSRVDAAVNRIGSLQSRWNVLQQMRARIIYVTRSQSSLVVRRVFERMVIVGILAGLGFFTVRLLAVLTEVTADVWLGLARGTFYTSLRVFGAIFLSTVWTVPVGIWIALSPRRLRIAQPVIQLLASFPTPMLFPLAVGLMSRWGIHFGVGSMFLMMMGVQWYILFNVLAGATKIPSELSYALELMRVSRWQRWKSLYLPSIFPSLVTGWVVAAGGAWNASVIAEYVPYQGAIVTAEGLGSLVTVASETKDFKLLAAGLTLMVLLVIGLNRTLWAKLFQIAQTRYRMDL